MNLWEMLQWLDQNADSWSMHQEANREGCWINVYKHYAAGPMVQEECKSLAELPATVERAIERFKREDWEPR